MRSDALAVPEALRRPRWVRRGLVWAWFLGVAVAGVGAYYLIPTGLPRDVLYACFGLAAVVAIEAGVRMNRPAQTLPWHLLALGTLLWATGDALGSWYADAVGVSTFPTIADPVYLLGYPVIGAGLVLLIRGRQPLRDRAAFLDSTIVTVALGLLTWVLLARPTIAGYGNAPVAATVAAAYPFADILLVGLLFRLVTTPGGRSRSFRSWWPPWACWSSPTPSSPP